MSALVVSLVTLLALAVPALIVLAMLVIRRGDTIAAQKQALVHSAEELAEARADEERKRERLARAWERELKRREALAKQPTEAEAKELEAEAEKAVKNGPNT